MRRYKTMLATSLEQDDITTKLDEALRAEQDKTATISNQLQQEGQTGTLVDTAAQQEVKPPVAAGDGTAATPTDAVDPTLTVDPTLDPEGPVQLGEGVDATGQADGSIPETVNPVDETVVVADPVSSAEEVIPVDVTGGEANMAVNAEQTAAAATQELALTNTDVAAANVDAAQGEIVEVVKTPLTPDEVNELVNSGKTPDEIVQALKDRGVVAAVVEPVAPSADGAIDTSTSLDVSNPSTDASSPNDGGNGSIPDALGTVDGTGEVVDAPSEVNADGSSVPVAVVPDAPVEGVDTPPVDTPENGEVVTDPAAVDTSTEPSGEDTTASTDTPTDVAPLVDGETAPDAPVETAPDLQPAESDGAPANPDEVTPVGGEGLDAVTPPEASEGTDTAPAVGETDVPAEPGADAPVTANTDPAATDTPDDTSPDANLNGEVTSAGDASATDGTDVAGAGEGNEGGAIEEDPDSEKSLTDVIEEVGDEEEEQTEHEDMVEEANSVSDRLGKIAEIVQETVEADEDGMSEGMARIVEIATESLFYRAGFERDYSMIATESFETTNDRRRAAQIALEDIQGGLKRIGASIVEAIKKALAFFQGIWQKFVQGAGHARKVLAQLKEAAQGAKSNGGQPREKSFVDENVVRRLRMGSSVPQNSKDLKMPLAYASMAVFGQIRDWSFNYSRTFVHGLNQAASSLGEFQFPEVQPPQLQGFVQDSDYAPSNADDSMFVTLVSPELPGGKVVSFNMFKTSDQDQMAAILGSNQFGGALVDHKETKNDNVSKELTTLTPDQVIQFCDDFEDVLKVMEMKKLQDKEFIGNFPMIIKIQDMLVGKSAAPKSLRDGLHAVGNMAHLLVQPAGKFASYMLDLSYAVISYCKKSLAMYEAKVTAPAQEPAMVPA